VQATRLISPTNQSTPTNPLLSHGRKFAHCNAAFPALVEISDPSSVDEWGRNSTGEVCLRLKGSMTDLLALAMLQKWLWGLLVTTVTRSETRLVPSNQNVKVSGLPRHPHRRKFVACVKTGSTTAWLGQPTTDLSLFRSSSL
jgi:hypothetical protein